MDIAATLLHLYGVPIPEDYDGQILLDLLTSELSAKPVQYQPGDVETIDSNADPAYSEAEAEELMSHLRALGYLD